MMEEMPVSILNLPPEVLDNVFGRLPLPDKKSTRFVCKYWCAVMDQPCLSLLRFKASISDSTSATHLVNSVRIFDEVRIENLKDAFPLLTFDCRNKFPPMKILDIGPNNSSENAIKSLKYGGEQAKIMRVQALALESLSLVDIVGKITNKIVYASLSELDLAIENFVGSPLQNLESHCVAVQGFLYFANCPTVQKLRLSLASWNKAKFISTERIIEILIAYYKFLNRHAASLRSLDLTVIQTDSSNIDELDGVQEEIIIPEDSLSHEFFSSLVDKIKLDSFSVHSHIPQTIIVFPCLMSEKLSTLTWHYWYTGIFGVSGTHDWWLRGTIIRNQKTLVSLDIWMKTFDIDLFENCKLLNHLVVSARVIVDRQARVPSLETLEINFNDNPTLSDWTVACHWVASAFRNIKVIIFASPMKGVSLQGLEVLLSLRKFQKIEYCTRGACDQWSEIEEFCRRTPGLTHMCSRMIQEPDVIQHSIQRCLSNHKKFKRYVQSEMPLNGLSSLRI